MLVLNVHAKPYDSTLWVDQLCFLRREDPTWNCWDTSTVRAGDHKGKKKNKCCSNHKLRRASTQTVVLLRVTLHIVALLIIALLVRPSDFVGRWSETQFGSGEGDHYIDSVWTCMNLDLNFDLEVVFIFESAGCSCQFPKKTRPLCCVLFHILHRKIIFFYIEQSHYFLLGTQLRGCGGNSNSWQQYFNLGFRDLQTPSHSLLRSMKMFQNFDSKQILE